MHAKMVWLGIHHALPLRKFCPHSQKTKIIGAQSHNVDEITEKINFFTNLSSKYSISAQSSSQLSVSRQQSLKHLAHTDIYSLWHNSRSPCSKRHPFDLDRSPYKGSTSSSTGTFGLSHTRQVLGKQVKDKKDKVG